ncbi:hypothetical protein [Sabulibacter ruber]|uniref:hypothetical protein n=1 Tax=Sabulibacter ruber TaxID=2811901 RepID=UPI001A96C320|nr:hypothetical protein [Sabulibacter ruber]
MLLLLSLLSYSCSDEDEETHLPSEPRLSKVLVKNTRINVNDLLTFTYTYRSGLLTEYRGKSEIIGSLFSSSYTYDNNRRLIHAQYPEDSDTLIYDKTGRLKSATVTEFDRGFRTTRTYSFVYDTGGRPKRVNIGGDFGPSHALLLSFDDWGNVIKEELFRLDDTTLSIKEYTTRITYDAKKNPWRGVGSPFIDVFFAPENSILSTGHQFIAFFSPNNPVEIKTDIFYANDTKIEYEYNSEGYPKEIRFGDLVQTLEYIRD